MKQMAHWHIDSFNSSPIGDGYEVEVNEFDFRDDNGICYDQDGVTIRHWRRSHTKDGASAYRLDWNGLSFVWTGDGRPDELTAEFAKGVDVFVTEVQPDVAKLQELKMGLPQMITNNTVDTAHTVHYAVGYLTKRVNPRLAMVTHTAFDEDLLPEILAGIRVALGRPVPVRRSRRRRRQRDQGGDLDPQRGALRGGQPGAAEPLRGQGAVRPRSRRISASISPTPGTTSPTFRRSSSARRRSIRTSTTRRTSSATSSASSRRGSRSRSRGWSLRRSARRSRAASAGTRRRRWAPATTRIRAGPGAPR